jgi:hypothetical protein
MCPLQAEYVEEHSPYSHLQHKAYQQSHGWCYSQFPMLRLEGMHLVMHIIKHCYIQSLVLVDGPCMLCME